MPAAERMTVEAPMVAMTMLKIGADMIGRTTTRSSTTPMRPDSRMVTSRPASMAAHTRSTACN